MSDNPIEKKKVAPRPITTVLMKNGRMGVIRESRTTIKHCKRVGAPIMIVFDGIEKADINAADIKSIVSSTL